MIAVVVGLGLVATACGNVETDVPIRVAADDPPAPNIDCDPALDAVLGTWSENGFTGTVAFTDVDGVTCSAGYGFASEADGRPNTPDTVFSIGSITKAVAAAAVLELVADGTLTMETTAGEVVDGLHGPAGGATIEQLLLHTSGVTGIHGRDHVALTRDEAIESISTLDAPTEPGSEFAYSNAGYVTLALVLDELSDTGYRDHLRTTVLSTGDGVTYGDFWDDGTIDDTQRAVGTLGSGEPGEDGSFAGPHWALDGAGGVAMTALDMAEWTRQLFTGELISDDARTLLLTTSFDQGDGSIEIPGWVGFDDAAFGESGFGTAGGGGDIGHNMIVGWLADTERAFVIASNGPDMKAEELLQEILPALAAGEIPTAPIVAGDVPIELAELAAGEWEIDGDNTVTITPVDGQLDVVAVGPKAVAAVFPVPEQIEAEAVAEHERLVLRMLDGETEEGRREVELLEENGGPITGRTIEGTIFRDGELRTWVTITHESGDTLAGWVAMSPSGSIAAVQLAVDPPTMRFVGEDTTLFPADVSQFAPPVTITIDGDTLTAESPGASETLSRR